MTRKQSFWKYFKYASTAVLITGALAPQVLAIPVILRPWIFLFTILWVFFLSTGVAS